MITGHTGFKGSWMCVILVNAGAKVIGYSKYDKEENRLFDLCGVRNQIVHIEGDVRDIDHLKKAFEEHRPEIVIHMAAQPLVREGYRDPVGTYETNVMGTVNVLECVHLYSCVKSFLNVTTDKVYENKEWVWGYRENDPLDGYDPYSNSKSCSELVTHSYRKSFFDDTNTSISTARAGNVIGGGDFAKDRIMPDCVRSALKDEDIVIRNPHSTRPYQHVLEVIFAYLMIACMQYEDISYSGYYNIGPDDSDCYDTKSLVDTFIKYWGNDLKCVCKSDDGPHEAGFLKLDSSKIKATFGWQPRWDLDFAIMKVVEWTKCFQSSGDVRACMNEQIAEFIKG